jgi:uncharacterized membrane protein
MSIPLACVLSWLRFAGKMRLASSQASFTGRRTSASIVCYVASEIVRCRIE